MNRRERTNEPKPSRLPSQDKEPTAVEYLHVSVPLKVQHKPVTLPSHFHDSLKDEYAIKYLQRLGADPTSENVATVLAHLPLNDCQITTKWKSRGSLADTVTIDLYTHTRNTLQAADTPMAPMPSRAATSFTSIETGPDTASSTDTPPAMPDLSLVPLYRVGAVCKSFDDMKRQYLLPFKHTPQREADVLTQFAIKRDDMTPCVPIPALRHPMTANPRLQCLGRRASQRRVKCVQERVVAPQLKPGCVTHMLHAFHGVLPLASLGVRSRQDRQRLRTALLDNSRLVQLVTAMTRYLYLEVFFKLGCLTGTITDPAIATIIARYQETAPAEIEALYVDVVRAFTAMRKDIPTTRDNKGVSLLLPLQVLALRVCIETIFHRQYPTSFALAAPTMRYILSQLDEQISLVLDPDQLLSRIGILETTCESLHVMAAAPFQQQKRATNLREQFFQTSETLHTIFPAPSSGKCRQILKLRGGAAIGHYPVLCPDREDANGHANGQANVDNEKRAASRDGHEPRHAAMPQASLMTKIELLKIVEANTRSANGAEKLQRAGNHSRCQPKTART